MPITKIVLENFKGVGACVEVPIRPITLLFGGNSAGKSTILQGMLYLRELLEFGNADADQLSASGESIDLGGFKQFVNRHDLTRKIRIGVTISVSDDGLPEYPVQATHHREESSPYQLDRSRTRGLKTVGVSVEVAWHGDTNKPWITRYDVEVDGINAGSISANPTELSYLFINYRHPLFSGFDVSSADAPANIPAMPCYVIGSHVVPVFGKAFSEMEAVPCYEVDGKVLPRFNIPEEVLKTLDDDLDSWYQFDEEHQPRQLLSRVFVGAGELVLKELQRVRYLGPIRTIPHRNFARVRSSKNERWADGSAAWDLLHMNSECPSWFDQRQVDELGLGYTLDWHTYYHVPLTTKLGAAIDLAKRFSARELDDLESIPDSDMVRVTKETKLRLIENSTGVDVAPVDIGVGISQLLPCVIGAMAPGYSVLCVEQPELHVHPAIQCRTADLLAKQAIEMDQERVMLLETHSEHLMLRLLRRIRENTEESLPPDGPRLKPEHLSVLYIAATERGLEITELPVTNDGDFSRQWPRGFFEERAAELF